MSEFKGYFVRGKDRDAAYAQAERMKIKKADLLGVLLRGWDKLGPRQKLDAMNSDDASREDSRSSVAASA